MMAWLMRIGVALAVVIGAFFLWRVLLVVAAAIATIVVGVFVADSWRKWRAVRRFRAAWGVHGKDLLLVYSNSPHWQQYIEETWLPRWGHRAVVLNWSERSTWKGSARAEVELFRAFAGDREFNPLGIAVPQQGRHARVVRFWRAFREHKHGKARLLIEREAELDRCLGTVGASAPDADLRV